MRKRSRTRLACAHLPPAREGGEGAGQGLLGFVDLAGGLGRVGRADTGLRERAGIAGRRNSRGHGLGLHEEPVSAGGTAKCPWMQ